MPLFAGWFEDFFFFFFKKEEIFEVCFPQAGTNFFWATAGIMWGSVHALAVFYCNSHCNYRIRQTWELASRHFAVKMFQWEKAVCVSVTVTLIFTAPQRNRVLSEAYFKHSPRLSVYALVMSAFLLILFTLLLIYLPQERHQQPNSTSASWRTYIPSFTFPTRLSNTNALQRSHVQHNRPSHLHHCFRHYKNYLGKQISINAHGDSSTHMQITPPPHCFLLSTCVIAQWHWRESHILVYILWKKRRGQKRLHPYSISGTSLE